MKRMDNQTKFSGIISAMITPFDDQERLNYQATKALVDQLIAAGVTGVFILGTNGEAHVLSSEEKIEFTKSVVRFVDKRVSVIAGIGMNSTQETIDLGLQMSKLGVDAFSIVPPSFVRLSQEELICHYSEIADALPVPVLIYNMPKLTGNNIETETVSELSRHPNIVGIKDSSGSIENIESYINTTQGGFSVFSGSDSLILKTLMLGGSGAVAATTNLIAPIIVEIYKSFLDNNLHMAKQYQDSIELLRNTLKAGSIPSIIKACVSENGIKVGPARRPIIMPKKETMDQVRETVNYYKRLIEEINQGEM